MEEKELIFIQGLSVYFEIGKDMSLIKIFILSVNKLNDLLGNIISVLVFIMMGSLLWEVIMRYFVNRPTIWAHELSAMIYAVYFLLGGAYTLRWNGHINMEIFYVRLSKRKRAILDLITWILFYLFIFIMLWDGVKFALTSIMYMEHSMSPWEPPIWPVKLCIPFAGFLMLLQGLAKTLNDIFIAVTGGEVISEMQR